MGNLLLKTPFGFNKGERRYWKQLAQFALEKGLLQPASYNQLKEICVLLNRLDDINRFLREENSSLVQATRNYGPGGEEHEKFAKSPYFDMHIQATGRLNQLYKLFGFYDVSGDLCKKTGLEGMLDE
jgi:hypothetical protein